MKTKAQSTIEFTFALIVILFLAYGLIQVFRWAGMDLAERRWASDQALTKGGSDPSVTAEQQLNLDFYRPKRINAVYRGW